MGAENRYAEHSDEYRVAGLTRDVDALEGKVERLEAALAREQALRVEALDRLADVLDSETGKVHAAYMRERRRVRQLRRAVLAWAAHKERTFWTIGDATLYHEACKRLMDRARDRSKDDA